MAKWQLTCSFQDELKNEKLLTDDEWQVAIGYSSDSSDLKKIQVLFTSLLFVNPLPPTPKKALTLSHGQRFSQFKNRNNRHNNNGFSLSLNKNCGVEKNFFKDFRHFHYMAIIVPP